MGHTWRGQIIREIRLGRIRKSAGENLEERVKSDKICKKTEGKRAGLSRTSCRNS